ncbi:MAG: MFS transporter [Bacteroidota bacterium]
MKKEDLPHLNPPYSEKYSWYVLFVLTGVYTFNFIDRRILAILQEPIKMELGLSDTQLGLLTGFAFAIFYVSLGIPIARWADRSNRKNIIALCMSIWSIMTAISGLVANYFQLILARIGVGIGEAGGSPPAHSIISDYFPPEKRATALSIYSIGIYIGIFLGFVVGGVVAKHYGWRVAFFVCGIPGVVYALLVYYTVKEPIKGITDKTNTPTEELAFIEVLKYLLSKKTFVFLAFASGLHTFASYGIGNFMPPFLMRIHHMEISEVGLWLGVTTGVGGALGTVLGGSMADRLRKKDMRWYIWISALAGALNFIPSYFAFFSENVSVVIIGALGFAFLTAVFIGPTIAVTHSLVNAKMRAFSSAILFFVMNLIGLGMGPLCIGLLSDYLSVSLGEESLRWAFTITFFTGGLSILLFYLASKNYLKDLSEN